ncbi:hypothetical protein Bhyg_09398 [Pseudolycoriella hygida]|uniref:Uncharacterized protein n=1 Tax=Pseudolycoriella hygida TaxID=35572 RepID=A0A9Q0S4D3_9DIPT|nr:hypothetical protein Bhyg_09398 [Pseudolycoriella hygida]
MNPKRQRELRKKKKSSSNKKLLAGVVQNMNVQTEIKLLNST